MIRDKCNIIICIQNKDSDYSFVGNAAKDKYMRDFQKNMQENINVIGFYCNDDYIKIVCMDTDEDALSKAVRRTNMLYGSYYKKVIGGTHFAASVETEYAYSDEDFREKYCRAMCGRSGEVFYADYQWSSISVLSGSNTSEYLCRLINPEMLCRLFGQMYLRHIIVMTINMKMAEGEVDKKAAVARVVIWKTCQLRDETEFRRKATIEEKCSVARTLYYVHRFSYMQIADVFDCSKSTVYRYLKDSKNIITR